MTVSRTCSARQVLTSNSVDVPEENIWPLLMQINAVFLVFGTYRGFVTEIELECNHEIRSDLSPKGPFAALHLASGDRAIR